MSKAIKDLKSGNYEVVDNQGVSVTTHFIECLEKEFADLETKLAESEKKILELQEDSIRDNQIYNEQLAEQSDLIYHLKRQLNCDYYKPCQRCKNPYGSSQFPSKDENGKEIYICSNCNEKELFYEPLIKQLEDQNDRLIKERDDANLKLSKLLQRVSEQNEEIENLNKEWVQSIHDWKEIIKKKDKQIAELEEHDMAFHNQLAVEQLEKVKDSVLDFSNGYWRYFAKNGEEYMKYSDLESCLKEYIDDPIKQLKEGK